MRNKLIKNKRGLKMLWPYSYDDKKTWKYKDCIISSDSKGNLFVNEWIYNDKFLYSNFDTRLV